MTHEYMITGMTCSKCVARVKSELLKLGDVTDANVQLEAPQATITLSKHIATTTLQQAVSKAGNYQLSESQHGSMHTTQAASEAEKTSYFPIFLIFAFIAGVSTIVQLSQPRFNWMEWSTHFMAGFFFVFSFFKLLDVKGFAEGYGTYDIVARRLPVWGFVYPFVELALGVTILLGIEPFITNIVVLIVMGVATIGVAQSLLRKSAFQCACLGTVIKVPLGRVTLFEDVLMVGMAAVMIIAMV